MKTKIKILNYLKRHAIACLYAIFYLFIHLLNLTALPVFADESIYIRWTQLIIDDWQQYLFFPLNDGKTPLHIWLQLPLQFLFSDQLYAARVSSVFVGLIQMGVMALLAKELGGKKKSQYLAALLTAILPFWYFHHRMALMDGLLTLFLSLTLLGVIRLIKARKNKILDIRYLILAGLFFGLSLLSKLPAVLFIPVLLFWSLIPNPTDFKRIFINLVKISLAIFIGLLIFLSLKLHPAFGQLFARGSDFLFPAKEIFLQGKWLMTIRNLPSYLSYFSRYLTLPVLLLSIYGLFSKNNKGVFHLLFWSAVIFIFPIAIMGRVVYPRYFLPISIFFTISAALALEELINKIKSKKNIKFKTLYAILLAIFSAVIIQNSSFFILYSLFSANNIPFVAADKVQYLHEWSSGHGIKESSNFIKLQAKTKKIAIATEGSFGTLPDGILMYLHRSNVDNIYVEGIGYPVKSIPEKFMNRAKDFDKIYLIVNSHRLEIPIAQNKLIKEYPRPNAAPTLQIWNITNLIKN
ncbi:MAG: glycosyltransferase family 39 protein [Patescibacteria group bacterium]